MYKLIITMIKAIHTRQTSFVGFGKLDLSIGSYLTGCLSNNEMIIARKNRNAKM